MDDRGSLDKAQVISALQSSGDADYDSVRDCPAREVSTVLERFGCKGQCEGRMLMM